MRLRISARKSDLARLQAYMVGEALESQNPGLEIEYRFKESLGDINLTDPLWKIPQKGVFTEDFYGELIRSETDMVVHSWKDLPTEHKSDTVIAATLPRADQRDLLLIKKAHIAGIREKKSLRVFSSSPRREYNLKAFFKSHLPLNLEQVSFESVRGNIPTRIRKLLESTEVDGLIVAKAALDRLLTASQAEFSEVKALLRSYLNQLDYVVLPLSVNPNAAAQGALAIEVGAHRPEVLEIVKKLNHAATFECAQKERDLLAGFGGGCHQKIGVAVLSRPYGQITWLRGETDQGRILLENTLSQKTPPPRFNANQLWLEKPATQRVPNNASLPTGKNAYFVARAEAWPEGFTTHEIVWTAGLKTWKKLAEKGIWVHGSSESLGEQEEARVEILASEPLAWVKLSHQESAQEEGLPVVATYQLDFKLDVSSFSGKEFFFWSSGSQFLEAVKTSPELLTKYHACGPGNTSKMIRSQLKDSNRLFIFLDADDWRKQCTKE
ncbi:hydroxymethylbilane synthase [Bdellovibrio sp. HCB2-146]|uniref:hydroxymethylbilane synthase n=1 Tax=Bdellovibrio sp. HCB2-146 TaxID=3394362 RepID=UPI0039BC56D1